MTIDHANEDNTTCRRRPGFRGASRYRNEGASQSRNKGANEAESAMKALRIDSNGFLLWSFVSVVGFSALTAVLVGLGVDFLAG